MIKDEIDGAYNDVMSKGDLVMRGQLKSFEENLAKFVGTKYAVGVNSGYDALHLSIICAGIGEGDEVIVPSHTFVASASAIVNAGATPVLVDVAEDSNINIDLIEPAITDKTRGIMPVHLNGLICDMERVIEIADRHNLAVVEDACQTLGGEFDGKRAGSWGLTGCWSFYPFKILGGYGDGGGITTDNEDVYKLASRLRYNGEDRETGEYYGHGYTCLLDNLQAAFLDVKLRHLPDWIISRRKIAEIYHNGLSGVGDLVLPIVENPKMHHIYQNYIIRTQKRDELFEFLKENGVETLIHWRKPYYRHAALNLEDKGFPVTEAISNEVISLPMNVEMEEDEARYVIKTIKKFF